MNQKSTGFFAREAKEFFPNAAIEDDGRLRNFSIREHFLIQIYTLAQFRAVKKSGKIVANHENKEIKN